MRDKIESYRDLPQGWHYGEGEAFSQDVIDRALALESQIRQYGIETDAFPGLGGEVLLIAYQDNKTWDVCVEPNGTVTLTGEWPDLTDDQAWEMLRQDLG